MALFTFCFNEIWIFFPLHIHFLIALFHAYELRVHTNSLVSLLAIKKIKTYQNFFCHNLPRFKSFKNPGDN